MQKARVARRLTAFLLAAVAGNYAVAAISAGASFAAAVTVAIVAQQPWYFTLPLALGAALMAFGVVALLARALIPGSWYDVPPQVIDRRSKRPRSLEELDEYLAGINETDVGVLLISRRSPLRLLGAARMQVPASLEVRSESSF